MLQYGLLLWTQAHLQLHPVGQAQLLLRTPAPQFGLLLWMQATLQLHPPVPARLLRTPVRRLVVCMLL